MDSDREDEQGMDRVLPRDEIKCNEKHSTQGIASPQVVDTTNEKFIVKCAADVFWRGKTHHQVAARKKPAAAGRPGTGHTESEQARPDDHVDQEGLLVDPGEFPVNVNKHQARGTGSQDTLSERERMSWDEDLHKQLTRDHSSMIDVLFARNLRLKVALTMWQRNIGELFIYLERIEDTGVVVDLLPILTKSIEDDSSDFTIGCCVDLFPFIKKVLSSPYEEYIAVGWKWIQSVLKKWFEEFQAGGLTGRTDNHSDKNIQVFNQQLFNLWHEDPGLTLIIKILPTTAKFIDSHLSRLT